MENTSTSAVFQVLWEVCQQSQVKRSGVGSSHLAALTTPAAAALRNCESAEMGLPLLNKTPAPRGWFDSIARQQPPACTVWGSSSSKELRGRLLFLEELRIRHV